MTVDGKECEHPKEFVFHLGKSLYQCMVCGHTSTMIGKPYFCNSCLDMHTLTHEQFLTHKRQVHGWK